MQPKINNQDKVDMLRKSLLASYERTDHLMKYAWKLVNAIEDKDLGMNVIKDHMQHLRRELIDLEPDGIRIDLTKER